MLQSVSRKQGTVATTPIVTTYGLTPDNAKNEGRIASITNSGMTGLNTTYAYTYDDQGRVASFTSPAGTRNYGYDSFDQIIGTAGGAQSAETYTYDTNGNRTVGAGSTATVIGAYNRITDDGTYTYLYDKEGNRTRRESKVRPPTTDTTSIWFEIYTWDYRQRLTSVTAYNRNGQLLQHTAYESDGLDRRIRRTVTQYTYPGSVQTATVVEKQRFLYDSNVLNPSFEEQVIMLDELANAQPYLQVDHRYMNGPAIDQVFADEGSGAGNQVLWYLSDSQNTVRDVAKYTTVTTGGTAKIRNHLEYDSFGNVTSVDDPTTAANTSDGDMPGLQGSGTVNQFSPQRSYTGREPDSATGLIYYRARWFDPQLGRFISEDPIGFAAGDMNLSRYVGNSTPNAVDPSGLKIKIDRQRLQGTGGAFLLRDGEEHIEINSIMSESILRGFENREDVVGIHYFGDPSPVPEEYQEKDGPFYPDKLRGTLTIGSVTDKFPSGVGHSFNSMTHSYNLQCGKDAATRDALLARLESLGRDADARFDRITLSGHGGPGRYGNSLITLDDLKDPRSRGYRLAKSLRDVLAKDAVIEIRACSVANGKKTGREFIKLFAEITGARVVAYTDQYAVTPHGEEWTAYPDGRVVQTGDHGPYKGSVPDRIIRGK